MNFRSELLVKALAGIKTQTRRPVKPGDYAAWTVIHSALDIGYVYMHGTRLRYAVNKVYAVCPGRGKVHQGYIRLLRIRQEDVRLISTSDVAAEGFDNALEFFRVWCGFYDKPAAVIMDDLITRLDGGAVNELNHTARLELDTRPDRLYQAWVLTFEVMP